jgi:outer membrane protein TolC
MPRARIRQANAGAAAALAEFNSVALRELKETEQSLALYGAELDRRQGLGEARTRRTRRSIWLTINSSQDP